MIDYLMVGSALAGISFRNSTRKWKSLFMFWIIIRKVLLKLQEDCIIRNLNVLAKFGKLRNRQMLMILLCSRRKIED
jgi:hypothetical protein